MSKTLLCALGVYDAGRFSSATDGTPTACPVSPAPIEASLVSEDSLRSNMRRVEAWMKHPGENPS